MRRSGFLTLCTIVLCAGVLLIIGCSSSRRAASAALPALPAWLELPAVKAADRGLVQVRYMDIDGAVRRNYSNLYDTTLMVSHWVAYPLNAASIGEKIRRTNTWGFDPQVPESRQQALFRGYRDGNAGRYTRGHQIASADRLSDVASNATTFYFTNMTPQRGDFNGGIWNTLEMKVRTWAKRCDTLYVVTGCVMEGATNYALDNNGTKIMAPVAYYKALLAYKKDDPSFGVDGYSGCAFLLEHEQSYDSSKVPWEMYRSIDEVEALTGEDFFPLLARLVGKRNAASVEAGVPSEGDDFWR